MSKCVRCGKDLVCDVPTTIQLEGREVTGMASAPHGCPMEYNHFKISCEDIGISRDTIEGLFKQFEDSGDDIIQHTTYEDGSDDFESGKLN